MNQDEQHLKLLSVFHYVVSALTALFSLFGLIYLGLGLVMLLAPTKFDPKSPPPPAFIGWLFAILGGGFILFGWLFAAFVAVAGRFLGRHKHYLFCLAMAGIDCVLMPFGTVLGVFTILVLLRPSVKALFADGSLPPPPLSTQFRPSNQP
jgi:hypothetical protein